MVIVIIEGLHLTTKGFLQILHFSYFINSTTLRIITSINEIVESITDKFSSTCYNTEAINDPLSIDVLSVNSTTKITIEYVAGLFDGDGCLSFIFSSAHRYVGCNFTIIQHIDDYTVLLELTKFFNCGIIYILPSGNAARFSVRSMRELLSHVKPVLLIMHLNTVKQEYILQGYKAWNIISNEGTQCDKNFLKVIDLVYTINNKGKSRKIDKEIYVSLIVNNRQK